MMIFEIDVSGEDLFNKDYTIVVAEKNGNSAEPLIYGYKFNEQTIQILKSRHGEGRYKYGSSHTQKALLKIRVYSIVIHYIFEFIHSQKKILDDGINLVLCRDFSGRENDIRANLKYLLTDIQKLQINSIYFCKLDKGSNADRYAFLMRKDRKNTMKNNYVTISLDQFEQYLKK